ncbi:MAG: hypothetical protein HY689_08890 [Chloroflexi bacterium]|nr:hypothetical protein [Chloroflexota bacterium]
MAEQPDPQRFQQDIEDALRRAGADRLPDRPRPSRLMRFPVDPRPRGPGHVIVAGIVLIVLWRFGLLGALGPLAANLGLLLLAFGIATWLIRPRRKTVYWRERPIDVGGGLSWLERLYYVFYKG